MSHTQNPKFGKKPLEFYTDSDRGDHEIALQILYDALRGRGYNNRISGSDLAEKLPVSQSTTYDLIQELRRDWGLPVYSRGGYFTIQDPDRLQDVIDQIDKEIATKEQTKQELCRAFNNTQ